MRVLIALCALAVVGCSTVPQDDPSQQYYPDLTQANLTTDQKIGVIESINQSWLAEGQREQEIKDRYQQAPIVILGAPRW